MNPVCGTCGNGPELITYPNYCIMKHVICSNPNAAIEWRCNGECPCSMPIRTPFTISRSIMQPPFTTPRSTKRPPFTTPTSTRLPPFTTPTSTRRPPFTTPWSFRPVTYWTTKPSTRFHQNGIPAKNCNRLCPYMYDAVCGSNGLTYPHKCMLENAACENPDKNILIKCNKECPCGEATFNDHSKIVHAAQQIRSGHARGSLKSGGN